MVLFVNLSDSDRLLKHPRAKKHFNKFIQCTNKKELIAFIPFELCSFEP